MAWWIRVVNPALFMLTLVADRLLLYFHRHSRGKLEQKGLPKGTNILAREYPNMWQLHTLSHAYGDQNQHQHPAMTVNSKTVSAAQRQ